MTDVDKDPPRTATVETLTAEVRVLMVGSRQVTMSVAKQLDHCEYHEMEPMGRVHLTKRGLEVLGRRRSDGALCHYLLPWDDLAHGRGRLEQRKQEIEALPLIVLAGLR